MKHQKVTILAGEKVMRLFAKSRGLTKGSLLMEVEETVFGVNRLHFTHGTDRYVLALRELRPLLAEHLEIPAKRIDDVIFYYRNLQVTEVKVLWDPSPLKWYEKLFGGS